MNKLKKSDLSSLEEYNSNREQFRKQVLTLKKDRKVQIGSNVTLLFENSDTIKYQVQEMLRIEKIFEQNGIEKELATYNPLIPDGSNLKATMLIEFPDEVIRKEKLGQLTGIEHKVWLQVGENVRIFAIADEDLEKGTGEKTSAVHFLRFELSNLMVKDLQSGATLFAGIDHTNYNVRTQEIQKATSDSLNQDLV
ncbi:MAG TPA: DUF3501 family protein [Gammaproteobacteria bacterium]|nr:DUF3501 family protein [Gammaproteobacteria bacterium]